MGNPQFSGTPFVVGSIRGERCWRVGKHGELISPAQGFPWVNGENVSRCQIMLHDSKVPKILEKTLFPGKQVLNVEIKTKGLLIIHSPFGVNVQHNYVGNSYFERDSDEYCHVTWKEPHPIKVAIAKAVDWKMHGYDANAPIDLDIDYVTMHNETQSLVDLQYVMKALQANKCDYATCGCGFYAYLNGKNEYLESDGVVGIIEGYGETHIGERGFRARKAKILAMAPVKPLNYKDVDWSNPVFGMDPANLSAEGFSKYGFVKTRNGKSIIAYNDEMRDLTTPHAHWARLKERYPDVAFFNNADVMRAEFPATNLDEVLGEG